MIIRQANRTALEIIVHVTLAAAPLRAAGSAVSDPHGQPVA